MVDQGPQRLGAERATLAGGRLEHGRSPDGGFQVSANRVQIALLAPRRQPGGRELTT